MKPFLPNIKLRNEDGTRTDYRENQRPLQREFHNSKAQSVLIEAHEGAGKSVAVLAQVIWELWMYQDNLGLILHEDNSESRFFAMKNFETIMPNWMRIESNREEHFVKVMNFEGYKWLAEHPCVSNEELMNALENVDGISEVIFACVASRDDVLQKFRSASFGFYMADEVETISIEIHDTLLKRLRRPCASRGAYLVSNDSECESLGEVFYPDSAKKRPDHEAIVGENVVSV